MTSNFYTNSYLKNYEKKEIDKENSNDMIKLLNEMLHELRLVACRLDNIERVVSK